MLPLNQVKTGSKVVFRSFPYEVIEAHHHKMGRGGAKLVTKLRNLLNHSVIDFTFQGDEKLEEAQISYQSGQFLYAEADVCQVMLDDSFEQLAIKIDPAKRKFLVEGAAIDLMFWQDQVIDLRLPKKVSLRVDYTEPATKGNTVTNASKAARLESGGSIQVPLFINSGDLIVVNSETGLYDSRG